MSFEYSPPIKDLFLISDRKSPEGVIDSALLLLTDSHEQLFALHVMTQEARDASLIEDPLPEDEEPEPVLVIDAHVSDLDELEQQVRDTEPDTLKDYLIPQN